MVDWISLSQTAGTSGTTTITITAATYSELTERTAALVVRAANRRANVTVQQAVDSRFTVSPTSFTNVNSATTNLNVTVTSDYPWAVASSPSWCSLSPVSASSGQQISITVSENTGASRNGVIAFTQSETGLRRQVSLSQIERIYETISVSPSSLNLVSAATAQTIAITSSADWTATTQSDWITITPSSGTSATTSATIRVGTNASGRRSGSVAFSNVDARADVSVVQLGTSSVSVDTPLTFDFYSGGTLNIDVNTTGNGGPVILTYSKNGGEWQTMTFPDSDHKVSAITVNANDTVAFKGNKAEYGQSLSFTSSASHDVYGNAYSIITEDFANITSLTERAVLSMLFYGDTGLLNARDLILPATTLGDYTYDGMFAYCENLISAPYLPATTVGVSAYKNMFRDCQSLTTAPRLLATTVGEDSYEYMFRGCTSLVDAPSRLPARNLGGGTYYGMFSGCTSLETPPVISATSVGNTTFEYMFDGCTSLRSAPSLSATTCGNYTYAYMFRNCTSLTDMGELAVNTVGNNACYFMFSGCTSLTSTPEINITTVASACCYGMFRDCTSLTATTSSLPATTLARECYAHMYENTAITTAPELPASYLQIDCYAGMFEGCGNLTSITCLSETAGSDNYTFDWVSGVGRSGTFTKRSSTTWGTGTNAIPSGWSVVDA